MTNNDPTGECPNCVAAGVAGAAGLLIGGGIEVVSQLWSKGKVEDWKAVGGAAVQGGVTGLGVGFTAGASFAVSVATGVATNVVGGIANNTIQGKPITTTSVVQDAAI